MTTDAEFEELEREYEAKKALKGKTCVYCNTAMFYSTSKPTVPGQVYSREGILEAGISRYCEHCFDEITLVDVGYDWS